LATHFTTLLGASYWAWSLPWLDTNAR
jgi:hypothetical protein